MEDVIITVNSWQWPYYKPIHGGFAEGAGDAVQVTALNPGDGVSFQMSVTANEKQELNVDVQRIAMSKGATVQVLEQENGRWVSLAEASLDKPDNISLIFTPTQGNVQIQVTGPVQTLITKLCLYAYQEVEQDELVTICSEDKDKYRWGVNGIEKVNEIAGIGNHYQALYGDYSSRTGFRWNLDPKAVSYISPYAMFRGNPILFSDPLLDTIIANKSSQGKIESDFKDVYKADYLEFNSNNELNFTNAGLKKLNSLRNYSGKNKKKLAMRVSLLGMEKLINSQELTGIYYSNSPLKVRAIDPGSAKPIDAPTASKLGGEFTLTKHDLKATNYSFSLMGRKLDNAIFVNPASSTTQLINVTLIKNVTSKQLLESIKYKGRLPFTNKRHSLLMHGLGHVLYQGDKEQYKVLLFDNINRFLSGDSKNTDPAGTHQCCKN